MAQYQVPQFLDVEDKIFGPMTFKQFLYTAGGLGLGFIAWTVLPSTVAIFIGGPIVLFFVALAFLKVNDRPFIFVVESAIRYTFSKKLYIWKKKEKTPEKKANDIQRSTLVTVPKLSQSKLRDLSWELDVHESLQGPEGGQIPENDKSLRETFKF